MSDLLYMWGSKVHKAANVNHPPEPEVTPDFDTVDFDDTDFDTEITT